MINKIQISFEDVFDLYYKIDKNIRSEEHFKSKKTEYMNFKWLRGEVKVKDLIDMKLHVEVWIKRIACNNHDCPEFTTDSCICEDPENKDTPNVRKVLQNISKNKHREHYKKIMEIIKAIRNNQVEDKFIIVRNDFGPYLIDDGNHRLIALSSMPEKQNMLINVYLGEKI